MQRIDTLANDAHRRVGALTGKLLDLELDGELQRLVKQAAEALTLPVALVTFVLQRTQFFRAYVGLPPELASARATDRDASFCQFVVRDGARFEVTNASKDDRVPKEMVERYGIESYLGEPIRVGGVIVGSVCVAGNEPRAFSDGDREVMARIAAQVSVRLDELARRGRAPRAGLMSRAASPAFAELRNILASMTINADTARVAAFEARPLADLVRRLGDDARPQPHAVALLGASVDALETLGELTEELASSAHRLTAMLDALKDFVDDRAAPVRIADVISTATALAHHDTKLVGGTSWAPIAPALYVRTSRPVAVAVLVATLSAMAAAIAARRGGIRGAVTTAGDDIVVELSAAALAHDDLARCVSTVDALVRETLEIDVDLRSDHIGIRIRGAPGANAGHP